MTDINAFKSQFKLGILKHHDIRCHWCEAWFLTFWSICQSGKVGLVGFFQKANIEQYALGGHHIAYRHCHRWFRWFLISSLVPLWALIFGSLLLPPLSIRARWLPCCCSFTFIQPRGVEKYFSDNQSDSRNGWWIHLNPSDCSECVNVKSDDDENKSMTGCAKRALQYVMSPGSFHWTRWLTKSRHLNLCLAA